MKRINLISLGIAGALLFSVQAHAQQDGRFSVTVGGTFPMPVAAYHNGVETERAPLYDGKSGAGSWVRLTGPASYVEYAYDSPITATGAYLHVSGGTTVEAFVAGQWVQVAQTSGPFKGDVHAVEGLSFTSDRWRVKRRSASGATSAVHEFRPGPSPMHLSPVFTTRPGFVATRGTTVAFAATGGTGYYTDAPLSYSFHEAGEIPDGLSLTDEGTLSVDPDADVATTWYFQVKVEDGVGFHDVRGFYVTHDAPAAADLMAHDFSLDGSGVDYRSMYDGAALDAPSPVSVNQSRALVVDFSDVPFIDSSGARSIDLLAARMKRQGARLYIAGTTPAVRRQLLAYGVTRARATYRSSVASALDELAGSRPDTGRN